MKLVHRQARIPDNRGGGCCDGERSSKDEHPSCIRCRDIIRRGRPTDAAQRWQPRDSDTLCCCSPPSPSPNTTTISTCRHSLDNSRNSDVNSDEQQDDPRK